MKMDLYQYEHELEKQGITYIGGVDEVGRGPLIGPVVTACCVLPKDFKLDGLTDSKKLSEKKREEYYDYIIEHCIAYAIGSSSAERIDEINIYEATKEAMLEAISKVQQQVPLEHVLIDAMPLDLALPHTSIIKGDAKSISIAAASVLAKVTRDRMLIELDKKYPMYGFASHKGYPTKKHIEAMRNYGLIEGYRKTYGPVSDYLGLEYFDLLNDHGKHTGIVMEKQELEHHGGTIGKVIVWLINDQQEVLIMKKNLTDIWRESSSDVIHTKMSKLKTALHTVKETYNLTLTTKDLVHVQSSYQKGNKVNYFIDIYVIHQHIDLTKVPFEAQFVSLKKLKELYQTKEFVQDEYLAGFIKDLERVENEKLFN